MNTAIMELEKEVTSLQERVTSMMIVDQESFDIAAVGMLSIKQQIKKVEAALGPQCDAAYQSWQTALAQKKKYITPLQEAEAILKSKMGNYAHIQEIKAEQARLEAQRKAEEEEAKAKAKIDKQIAKAEAKGDTEMAQILELQKETMVIPIEPTVVPVAKVNGVSLSDEIEVTIVDPMALIQAIANKTLQINLDKLITWKLGALKTYISTTGAKSVPGVTIRRTKKVSGKI